MQNCLLKQYYLNYRIQKSKMVYKISCMDSSSFPKKICHHSHALLFDMFGFGDYINVTYWETPWRVLREQIWWSWLSFCLINNSYPVLTAHVHVICHTAIGPIRCRCICTCMCHFSASADYMMQHFKKLYTLGNVLCYNHVRIVYDFTIIIYSWKCNVQ